MWVDEDDENSRPLVSQSLRPPRGRAYHQLVGTTPAHDLVVAGREAVRAGDFDAAARCLEAALAIEPSPEAYAALAYLGYVDDDFEEARRLWELAYHGYLSTARACPAAMMRPRPITRRW